MKARPHGVIPAVITTMKDDGSLDEKSLAGQAAYLSESGVDGFFVGGTTAEGSHLSTAEIRRSYEIIREAAQGRQFLCLASLRPSTAMVVEEVQALRDLKPDYLVVIAPFYLAATQEDIRHHFREVLEIAPAPVIVYNIPGTTHNLIELDTVLELAADPRVVGTKDSSGDFVPFSRGVMNYQDEGFSWIQGEDYLHGPSLMIGAHGVVSGLGNIRIDYHVEMVKAARTADWERVLEMQRRIDALYAVIRVCGGRTIAAIKAGVSLLGRCGPKMRMASMSPTAEDLKNVESELARLTDV